jgi:hypothetical protein
MRQSFLLRDLDSKGSPFCSPTAVVTWFGRQLAMVKVLSGEAPTPRMALTTAVTTGGPPPSSSLAREALVWWVDDASLGGNGG